MTLFDELRRVIDEGGRAVVLTVVSGESAGAKLPMRPGAKLPMRPGAKLLVRADGTTEIGRASCRERV
jgi:hypothetical protein